MHKIVTEAPADFPAGFYVADGFGSTFREAIIAGPFDTFEAADSDRRERNIAEDCEVVEIHAPDMTAHFQPLTLRYLGDNLTLARYQWEALLEDLRPDTAAARRVRGMLDVDPHPDMRARCPGHERHPGAGTFGLRYCAGPCDAATTDTLD